MDATPFKVPMQRTALVRDLNPGYQPPSESKPWSASYLSQRRNGLTDVSLANLARSSLLTNLIYRLSQLLNWSRSYCYCRIVCCSTSLSDSRCFLFSDHL